MTPGTAGAPFLKIGYSARVQGIGGSFAGLADDVCTNEFNPGGIANLKGTQYMFSHISLYEGVNADNFSFASHFGNDAIGVNARLLKANDYVRLVNQAGVDELELSETNEITLLDYAFSAIYARNFLVGDNVNDELKFGVSLTSIGEKLFNSNSSAVACDAGILYTAYKSNTSFGMALQNLGSKISDSSLPSILRIGLGYHDPSCNVCCDLVQAIDSKTKACFGTEIPIEKTVILRIGAAYQQDFDFTAGLGLNFGFLRIDFSIVPTKDLGQTYFVSLFMTPSSEEQ